MSYYRHHPFYLRTLNKQGFDSKFRSLCLCLSSRGIHAGTDVAGCPDIVIVTLAVGLSWLFSVRRLLRPEGADVPRIQWKDVGSIHKNRFATQSWSFTSLNLKSVRGQGRMTGFVVKVNHQGRLGKCWKSMSISHLM